MPFFLPSRLIDFEYFGSSGQNSQYDEIAKDYEKDIDFAFFVVYFHYTKNDYEALTPKERLFIYKAWEDKTVSDSYNLRNAVNNAIVNANRKKGKKAIPLWKKKQKRLDKNVAEENMKLVENAEIKDGKGWVGMIYAANGMKMEGGK